MDITSKELALTHKNSSLIGFLLSCSFQLVRSSKSGMEKTCWIAMKAITAVRHALMFTHGTYKKKYRRVHSEADIKIKGDSGQAFWDVMRG